MVNWSGQVVCVHDPEGLVLNPVPVSASDSRIPVLTKMILSKYFFFMAHLILISNSAHDTYSCMGTSGKKLPKPSWGGFGKKSLHRVFDRNPMSTSHEKGSIYTPTPVDLKQQFVKFYVKWCMPILYEHNIKRFLFV